MFNLSLEEWLLWAARGGNSVLLVPEYIVNLSCGCVREKNAEQFVIKNTQPGWVHNSLDCKNPSKIITKPPHSRRRENGGSSFVRWSV